MSLDGFIAAADGSYDWIVQDPTIDFGAMFAQYDCFLVGRKTYEMMAGAGNMGMLAAGEVIVFSRTLTQSSVKNARVVADNAGAVVADLKRKTGKDIWVFGGGELFRSLVDAGVVDTVEVAVIPVMLGSGVPLIPAGNPTKLTLRDHRILPNSGIVALAYTLHDAQGAAPTVDFVKKPRTPSKARKRAARVSKAPRAPQRARKRSVTQTRRRRPRRK